MNDTPTDQGPLTTLQAADLLQQRTSEADNREEQEAAPQEQNTAPAEETQTETPVADQDPDPTQEQEAETQAEADDTDTRTEDNDAQPTTEDTASEGDDSDLQILNDEYDDVLIQIGENQIPLADLKKGNLRQSDYSKKTEALAQERRELQQERAEFQQKQGQALQTLEGYLQTVGKPAEPDWQKIQAEDPLNFAVRKHEYEQAVGKWQEGVNAVQSQRHAEMQQVRQQTADMFLQKFPEFQKDHSKFQETQGERETLAREFGFTQPEITDVVDLRVLGVFEEVRNLRAQIASLKKAPNVKRKPVKISVQKGGKSKTSQDRQAERVSELKTRARDSSRPLNARDAAAMLFEIDQARSG